MNTPEWASSLDSGFNVGAAPITAYCAFSQWFIVHRQPLKQWHWSYQGWYTVSWPWPPSTGVVIDSGRCPVDHLDFTQCAGFTGGSFNKAQHVFPDLQVQWTGAFSDALGAVLSVFFVPHTHMRAKENLISYEIWMTVPSSNSHPLETSISN